MYCLQREVKQRFPEADGILPYLIYTYASVLRLGSKQGFHAVCIESAAGSIEETRSTEGFARIAFLPELEPEDLGFKSK